MCVSQPFRAAEEKFKILLSRIRALVFDVLHIYSRTPLLLHIVIAIVFAKMLQSQVSSIFIFFKCAHMTGVLY